MKKMTSKERLLTVMRGEIPDCVPVAPDFSNMIPALRTGKPWWDIYLYNDPPLWEAYIDCAKHYDIDSLMDGYFPFVYPWEEAEKVKFEEENPAFIVKKCDEYIAVQRRHHDQWHKTIDVYWRDKTPAMHVSPQAIGLPKIPESFSPLTGVKKPDWGIHGLRRVKTLLGDQGLVGVWVVQSCFIFTPDDLYYFFDHPEETAAFTERKMQECEKKMAYWRDVPKELRPDFLCFGGSGSLVLQTIDMVKEIIFPVLKRGIALAKEYGYFTQIHSCGPEAELVKLMAEESELTVIDPLEIPPMGDCNLAELKRLYGEKLILKGNLHTTDVMLNGSVETVIAAAKKAIDDAKCGGRFILSTGDQCGRDTPPENLRAMVETARNYGKY